MAKDGGFTFSLGLKNFNYGRHGLSKKAKVDHIKIALTVYVMLVAL